MDKIAKFYKEESWELMETRLWYFLEINTEVLKWKVASVFTNMEKKETKKFGAFKPWPKIRTQLCLDIITFLFISFCVTQPEWRFWFKTTFITSSTLHMIFVNERMLIKIKKRLENLFTARSVYVLLWNATALIFC
jgi:hypothetical protein